MGLYSTIIKSSLSARAAVYGEDLLLGGISLVCLGILAEPFSVWQEPMFPPASTVSRRSTAIAKLPRRSNCLSRVILRTGCVGSRESASVYWDGKYG